MMMIQLFDGLLLPLLALALGHASMAVAGGSGSSSFCHTPSKAQSGSTYYLQNNCWHMRSQAFFISTRANSHSHSKSLTPSRARGVRKFDNVGSSSVAFLASSSEESFGTKNSRQKIDYFVPPEIDAFTKQQISNIFGSADKPEGKSCEFVPMSFAGRWSRKETESQTQTPSKGYQYQSSFIETVFLTPPEECQTIANAYKHYLKSRVISKSGDELGSASDSDSILELDQPIKNTNALPIPISPTMSFNAIKLLSQAYSSDTPLSKSVLLSLNSLFINRDGGLFDNLPWSTWSIDPNLTERDAANNVIEKKYTMGKRAAYQRFMGKDWQGRSLSLGNLANRIRYLLERESGEEAEYSNDSFEGIMTATDLKEEDVMMSLSQRLLQLEMKEAEMKIAECEQQLAIAKTQSINTNEVDSRTNEEEAETEVETDAIKQLKEARERLKLAESSLEELTNNAAIQSASEEDSASSIFSFAFPWNNDKNKKNGDDNGGKKQSNTKAKAQTTLLISILDKLAEQEKPPPYRGAMGYPAKLDSKKEMLEDSILPYSSPYELLLEIIDEQLNSDVMGCVLEPTSLLKGNLVLGGALLLKRKGVQKSTTMSGEKVLYTDDDDELGNEGVLPRSMYVVECFSDEAIGIAMASNLPVLVEEEIYNRAGSVPVELDVEKANSVKMEYGGEDNRVEDMGSLSFANRVPPIRPFDESYFTSQIEGESVSSEKESNLVRIPLTTNPQLFDGPNQVPQSSSSARSPVFSTFNPVKSLDEYDELTDDAKARLLLKLESFTGYLPRPRAVRMSTRTTNDKYDNGLPPSLLDDIMLPLIDESVRRQYSIRDAERRKDFEEANALRAEVSPRQVALESAQIAREEGLDDEAKRMEEEAELYKALRADVTQDEGAYSRFLDRDEWYERETQARIKRLDKSKFGTLLDGIDLP